MVYNTIQRFMDSIRRLGAQDYFDAVLFCFAAPTIKGIKAGSLICLRRANEDAKDCWCAHSRERLRALGVESVLLRSTFNPRDGARSALVLVYHRELLSRVLCRPMVRDFLASLGYPSDGAVEMMLAHLLRRCGGEFPHEVGVFLGYPPEDVGAFIRYGGKSFRALGYWKVYGNVRRAMRAFRRFRSAEHEAARSFLLSGE